MCIEITNILRRGLGSNDIITWTARDTETGEIHSGDRAYGWGGYPAESDDQFISWLRPRLSAYFGSTSVCLGTSYQDKINAAIEAGEVTDDTEHVTISIRKNGQGTILSSGGDNSLAERDHITVPRGYEIYLQAGQGFQKWSNGQVSTENPIRIIADHNGNITGVFEDAAGSPQCPRGEAYDRPLFGFGACDNGYVASSGALVQGWGGQCVCVSTQQGQKIIKNEDQGITGGLESTLKIVGQYLPYAILLIVLTSIIGAFKK